MAEITITLTDTPTGGVSIHSSFKPAIGGACTAAQAAALDIISRTRRDYGLPVSMADPVQMPAQDCVLSNDDQHKGETAAWCACDDYHPLQKIESMRCHNCGKRLAI